ncbi:hypothetical protein A2U01_0046444 [Trifolium medium]|uniref:Uncharacterized protein n=1 Tax=Trifolium medium TaxID=97028 RepID=A0A392QN07_9FABA|nr:hypothetical protein [Trifolium medium]
MRRATMMMIMRRKEQHHVLTDRSSLVDHIRTTSTSIQKSLQCKVICIMIWNTMKDLKFIENVKCSLSFSSEGLYECIENRSIKKTGWVIAGNMVEKVPEKK